MEAASKIEFQGPKEVDLSEEQPEYTPDKKGNRLYELDCKKSEGGCGQDFIRTIPDSLFSSDQETAYNALDNPLCGACQKK